MSEENVELVKRGVAALNRQDRESYLALLDSDSEWHPTGETVGQQRVYRGQEEIWEYVTSFWDQFDGLRIDLEGAIDAGDKVVVASRMRGRGKASGAVVDMRLATVFTVRDGLLLRAENFAEMDEALEAAGLEE
jgi:ketosteroid isomerase-like protein